ncbi:uncharacterized protein NPIL_374221 [Nephila pilipes]|uniref:Uncharacterized protein n=1 Tax=Nephila pilipes TaxID=299642 RepID=A0A8X6P2Y6_NEPPI|nr:uncharacterized protein NPIL_374221 [Nephila pilipes]
MATCFFTKSLFPIRQHLVADSCNKTSIQSLFENALEKTRQFLRVFYGKKPKLSTENFRSQHRLPVEFYQNSVKPAAPSNKFVFYRPGFLQNVTSKWVSESIAGVVGKQWRRKALQRGGGPMLCFAGFVLAKKPSLLTEEEECEGVSYLIRDSFSSIPWQNVGLNIDKNYAVNRQFSLSDLKIGEMIAKGCNAAVYSACFQQPNSNESSISDRVEVERSHNTSNSSNENEQNLNGTDKKESIKVEEKNDNLLSYTRLIMSHSEGEQSNSYF